MKNETDLAIMLNNKTLIDYLNRLKMIATSLFTWEGLEDINCDNDFLENTLFDDGKAVFIQDETLGYMTLRVNPTDKLNVYNKPVKVMAYSNEYHKIYDLKDVVYIKNNNQQIPTAQTIFLMAHKLYKIDRTIDINIDAQKTPVLIEGDTSSKLTLENLYMKYTGNVPFIFGNKNFDLNSRLNVIKTDAPYLADKLTKQKHEVLNEALTFLGINNANTDKKERMLTDEINANNEIVMYFLNCFYRPRKKACDEINKKFFKGEEKIKIKINNEFITDNLVSDFIKEMINKNNKNVGDNNGTVHSDNQDSNRE